MSIRRRIFFGILFIVGIGFYFLIDWIVGDLTPQYREATEEPLVDASQVLASVAAVSSNEDGVDVELFRRIFEDTYKRTFEAQIYNFLKTEVDYRVYITDAQGLVIFDSDNGRDVGKDYSAWRDVRLTLEGKYGARTSRDIPDEPGASVLYIAAPIVVDNETIGVLSVGKPTRNANQFIEEAKRKIIVGGLVSGFSLVLIALLISAMITRPIHRLTTYARAIRDGRREVLPRLSGREIVELGEAFEQMRDTLEGKQYVENYVQTLTHEVKSPLSAIQGAVELLNENPPEARRQQFLENIRTEATRIQQVVEKLLLLSKLETRKALDDRQSIELVELLEEVVGSLSPTAVAKGVTVTRVGEALATFQGDPFLIRHALVNLLQNAIDFSPENGEVHCGIEMQGDSICLAVEDQGPGVPDFAAGRVFERFYSLQRPDSGKKSSGLGLSLVQEVADIHGGRVTILNRPEGGARAELSLPTVLPRS